MDKANIYSLSQDKYSRLMMHIKSLPIIALITTGRTGSDFLQSLLDSHKQILTFNGHFAVYSEFFSHIDTSSIDFKNLEEIADKFISKYIYKLISRYDIQEAKDRLGVNSDEFIDIDTNEFKNHLIGFLTEHDINSHNFLLAVYGAYNLCLNRNIEDTKIIFHHPHLDYEFKLFYKDFPKTKIIFTTRDPRANFCSHVEHFRQYYPSHDNQQHLFNCLKMILEDSELAQKLDIEYTAVRLEDLPREDIMRELAKWLNVEYQESLLRSTWAGLDWHGDRISQKTFKSIGWSKDRSENNWQNRLGKMEQYIFNLIINDRLKKYRYDFKLLSLLDFILIAFLILCPFKYERRFFSPKYLWSVLCSGNRIMYFQLLLTPLYYLKRIMICYCYYFRTLKGIKFEVKYIRSSITNNL